MSFFAILYLPLYPLQENEMPSYSLVQNEMYFFNLTKEKHFPLTQAEFLCELETIKVGKLLQISQLYKIQL